MGRIRHFRNAPSGSKAPGGSAGTPQAPDVNVVIAAADQRHGRSLARMIEAAGHGAVVLGSGSAPAQLEASSWPAADVCILDAQLLHLGVIEWVRHLQARCPELPILVWGTPEDESIILAGLRAGAVGHLGKGDDGGAVAASLRQVLAGGSPLSPELARELIREVQRSSAPSRSVELSPRERSVLGAIRDGRSYKEIACTLGIATNTVHAHVRKIHAKLRVTSRTAALRRAQELGMIKGW